MLLAQLQHVGESHILRRAPHCFEALLRSRHLKYGTTIGTTSSILLASNTQSLSFADACGSGIFPRLS
jgi:hypothetical protein